MKKKKKQPKVCVICGKQPASGFFMVLCDDCKKEMRNHLREQDK